MGGIYNTRDDSCGGCVSIPTRLLSQAAWRSLGGGGGRFAGGYTNASGCVPEMLAGKAPDAASEVSTENLCASICGCKQQTDAELAANERRGLVLLQD